MGPSLLALDIHPTTNYVPTCRPTRHRYLAKFVSLCRLALTKLHLSMLNPNWSSISTHLSIASGHLAYVTNASNYRSCLHLCNRFRLFVRFVLHSALVRYGPRYSLTNHWFTFMFVAPTSPDYSICIEICWLKDIIFQTTRAETYGRASVNQDLQING